MMALVTQRNSLGFREARGFAALAACLVLGACAQAPTPALPEMLSLNDKPAQSAAAAKDELVKATQYWGMEYAKNPRDLQTALSYAKDLKAMGEKQRAMAVLQQASIFHGQSRELASEYGRLALELDQISVAGRLLAAADDPANPDWRIISARGTVLAKQGKYGDAIPYYERALTLAHDHPSILSNLALALAMNGEPARAETMLRQAATTDRSSLKIRQNLALVLGLQGKYDEAKLLASRDLSAESAAENTDYLRRIVKLEPNVPPTSKAQRKVAQAKAPSRTPRVETADAKSGAKSGAKPETAQDGETSPGTKPSMKPALGSESAQDGEDVPSAETIFSVAQWIPETEPAPQMVAVKKPAAAKATPQITQGK